MLVIDSRKMKKIIAYSFLLLSLAGCMKALEETTPEDRAYNMKCYTYSVTANHVQMPVSALALALRIDQYLALSEEEKSGSEWSDLKGAVYTNKNGNVVVEGLAEFNTAGTSINLIGSAWKAGDVLTLTCVDKNVWICSTLVNSCQGSFTVTRTGDDGKTWSISDFTANETYEGKIATFSAEGLTAVCDGKLVMTSSGYLSAVNLDLPDVSLTGKIHLDISSDGSTIDSVDATWKKGEVTWVTSRD